MIVFSTSQWVKKDRGRSNQEEGAIGSNSIDCVFL